MEIEHRPDFSRFVIEMDGEIAELRYKKKKDLLYFTHTHVPNVFRGQGIAAKLVEAGLHFAREKGYKVVGTCSYVGAYLDKHPEHDDIKAKV